MEIFLDTDRSGHDYSELEISPANVVCDLRMIDASPWKGDFELEPRGSRDARAAARKGADGRPTGWTATAFLPWKGLRALPSAATRHDAARPGRPLALQRVPHRAARRQGRSGEGRRGGRVVEAHRSTRFHDPSVFRDMVFVAAAR